MLPSTTLVQRVTIFAPSTATSVGGLSADGDRVLLGTFEPFGSTAPSRPLLFQLNSKGLLEYQAELVPTGLLPSDNALGCLQLHGQLAFLGFPYTYAGALNSGAVLVFREQGDGSWLQVSRIDAPLPASYLHFGQSLHYDGQRLCVGAPGAGPPSNAGAAFVFESDGADGWIPVAKLVPPVQDTKDYVGTQVQIDGGRAVLSAPGTNSSTGRLLYFVEQPNGFWANLAPVTFSIPSQVSTSELQMGASMETSGERVAFSFEGGKTCSVVVARMSNSFPWVVELYVDLDLPDVGFVSLDLKDSTLLIGSHSDDFLGPNCGRLLEYRRNLDNTWSLHSNSYLEPLELDAQLGKSVALVGDQFVATDRGTLQVQGAPGPLLVFDAQSLQAEPLSLSLAHGEEQQLELLAGPAQAGKLYLMLGSTAEPLVPATPCGQPFPLTPDAYFDATIFFANQAPFFGSLGLLDADGWTSAKLVVPAGSDPALAGLVLHHAFAVFDPLDLTLDFASNSVSVALVP